ncbi:TPA: hypothetical protein R4217_000341 [Enterobacter soli]|nr:hypothetical protein [Enterobacter soli]
MIRAVIRIVKNIFATKNNIMSHDANGEPCYVCHKAMHKKQGITLVASGEKMHTKCWGNFIEQKAMAIKKIASGEFDA